MAGGYYAALSGMRSRMETLDRLASDIANASRINRVMRLGKVYNPDELIASIK